MELKLILVDGYSVETTEAGERAIQKLSDERKSLNDKITDLETKITEANTAKSTLEGEKAALEAQLADATSPEKLSAAATARAALIDQAKKIDPKIVTDGKTDAEIRKAAVLSKLGDAAASFDDNKIEGAFAMLAVTSGKGGKDQIADHLRDSTVVTDESIEALRAKRDAAKANRFNRAPADKE